MTYLQGFCESQGKNQPVKTDESSVIFSQIPLPVPKAKTALFRGLFFRKCPLFCLVITLYDVKGYAAFHKTSTADAVPEVFCSLATSQSIFALQKSLLRRTLFRCAKQVRQSLYPSQKQKQPSFEDCFFRQFSLFCLVITLYDVKGYAAFHKTSTADAVPEVFCSLATSQSIFALQKSLLRRTLFRCAKQVR